MSNPITQLKIMHEVAIKAEHFYSEAETLGKLAADNMGKKDKKKLQSLQTEKADNDNEKTGRHRSQITGLENVANSALKVTDILDYLKTQTARKPEWQQEQLGDKLITMVHKKLRDYKKEICDKLSKDDPILSNVDSYEGIQIHLYLIREFVRQFAAHYEYSTMQKGEFHD